MSDTSSSMSPSPLSNESAAHLVSNTQAPVPAARKLRLWPGVVIVAAQFLAIAVASWAFGGTIAEFQTRFMAPMIAGVAIVIWWLFLSRIAWTDRFAILLAAIAVSVAAAFLCHPSVTFGLIMSGLPAIITVWVGWLLFTPFLQWPARRLGLVVGFVLTGVYFTLLRMDGVDGAFSAKMSWRWQPTAEERFLAEKSQRPAGVNATNVSLPAEALTVQPGDWPGFRGPERDGRRTGTRIASNWQQNPPRQLWKKRVGPGWSSFTVIGNHLYTQEQRGDVEVVVCYNAENGEEIWVHNDTARFTEAVAGPGPRATPTFHDGKLYTLGAKGTLNCLEAATGKVHWSHDIVADSEAKVPTWGFSASPQVAQGVVTVFAGGPNGKAVLGYNINSGDLAWSAGEGKLSYCSTQLAKLDGVEQLLIATEAGITSFQPARGEILWQYEWKLGDEMNRVVQPTIVSDTDVLLGTGFNNGMRRIHVQHVGDRWETKEVWSTKAISPYFNDMVVHQNNLYGFDGQFFTCVNLDEGKKKWRARGYGNGQVLLLSDQNLLLILSETGDVALVETNPESHKEIARIPAIEGKSWNHPVVAHGKLFVRNGEEMACFDLTGTGKKDGAAE